MSETKKCARCGEIKPLDAFNKCKRHKDGLSYICRECSIAYNKEWRKNNPDKCRAYRRKYYIENWDAISVKRKKYYRENHDAMLEYQREYRSTDTYKSYKRMYDRMRRANKKRASA